VSDDKKSKTSGSGEYSLMLNQTLRHEDVDKKRSARKAYEQARQTPSVDSELPPPRAPMATDPQGTAAREVRAATVALTTSVDQICEALVLVFGEMKAASTTLAAVTRVLMLLMVGQMLVFGFMGYMVWRLEAVVQEAEQTRAQQERASVEIAKLKISSDATRRTVDEVKEKAAETPTVEIVADENKPGSAVVRIVPPSRSAHPNPSSSSLEIPLKLEDARPAEPTRH